MLIEYRIKLFKVLLTPLQSMSVVCKLSHSGETHELSDMDHMLLLGPEKVDHRDSDDQITRNACSHATNCPWLDRTC